ncbi:carbohydrate-binding domain-containing protein [Streptococcus sp. IMAU 99125]|uniref:Carbohydrate-binding domain-containing protein n=1 Tax=Streptococcus humanilactis TaxID=2841061 RepID=A0ABS7DW21_9STRE|nr:carbohydrate-binding domain-containing protein [Streptococcus humanilactis]MBW7580348.1 carbohydrate-binding domain-containing protein [Streptococcus humanilactis]MBW7582209.1 carbohydrate-binding domain-containing protein [Streptococcus humanilactis]
MKSKKWILLATSLTAMALMAACAQSTTTSNTNATTNNATTTSTKTNQTSYFTEKDYDTSYDESTASKIELSGSSANVSGDGVTVSGSKVTISKAGTYVISGQSDGVQIKIAADKSDDVKLVLKGVTMTNTDAAISATSAGHVYLTLAEGTTNSLSDSSSNSDEKANASLFSKVDLTINGSGILNVDGKKSNAIKANDTLHITGGTFNVTSVGDAFNVNDELNVTGATMTIDAKEDGVKVDNDDDMTVGNMYLANNTITVTAGEDSIHASGNLVIDSGTYTVKNATEGIEGKSITINGGDINVYSTDDGVNAANKNAQQSDIYFTMTGGNLTVEVGQGDTDPIDSNGNIMVTGGTIKLIGQSGFDFDGTATYTGGDIYINGEKQIDIVNSMPGGGGLNGGPGGPAPGGQG